MNLWYSTEGIVENIIFSEDEDQIVQSFSSNGSYLVESLYTVITHRGVLPVYVQAEVFLQLLAKKLTLKLETIQQIEEK